MKKQDLLRLITAIETNNPDHYHGDLNDGILDCLKELSELKDTLEEVRELLTTPSDSP